MSETRCFVTAGIDFAVKFDQMVDCYPFALKKIDYCESLKNRKNRYLRILNRDKRSKDHEDHLTTPDQNLECLAAHCWLTSKT